MTSKEILVVSKEDKELTQFLERLRIDGSLTVEMDNDRFLVEIRPVKVLEQGRRLLSRGDSASNE